jgi:hypothetical protein
VQVAAPGLRGLDVSPERVIFFSDHFAQQLALRPQIRCITSSEIATLVSVERQKQILSCAEDASSSCIIELANALGVDGTVTGSIGRVGGVYQANVKILAARDGSQLAAGSAQATSEEGLLASLTRLARQLGRSTLVAMGREVTAMALAEGNSGVRRWWWVPGAAGVAAAGVGVVFLVRSEAASAKLRAEPGSADRPATLSEAERLAASGRSDQTLSQVAMGVAATGLLTAGALWVFGGEEGSTTVAVVPTSAGLLSAATLRF